MGYRIKSRDIMVEVDSEEELRAALRVLSTLDEKVKPPVHSEKNLHPGIPKLFSTEDKMAKMASLYEDIRSELKGGMMEIIKNLTTQNDWITVKELKKNLTLEGSGLGGTLGAISKKSIKAGLKKEDVLLRKETKEGVCFRLTPAMIEVVKSKSEKELPQPMRIPQ